MNKTNKNKEKQREKKISQLIKEKRKYLKESQSEFGNRFGVTKSAVINWENGKVIPKSRVIDFVTENNPKLPLSEKDEWEERLRNILNQHMYANHKIENYREQIIKELEPVISTLLTQKLIEKGLEDFGILQEELEKKEREVKDKIREEIKNKPNYYIPNTELDFVFRNAINDILNLKSLKE